LADIFRFESKLLLVSYVASRVVLKGFINAGTLRGGPYKQVVVDDLLRDLNEFFADQLLEAFLHHFALIYVVD
jgi:hypothetical protein